MYKELVKQTLSIKLFASLKQAMSSDVITVHIENEISVSQMKKIILETYPNLVKLNIPFFVAVNHKIAKDSTVVTPKDEVALIPPVSGG